MIQTKLDCFDLQSQHSLVPSPEAVLGEMVLEQPSMLYEVPENLQIDNATPLQLVQLLNANGWEMNVWVPVSQRRRRNPIPYGYVHDAAKQYFVGLCPLPEYLRALLRAEDHYGNQTFGEAHTHMFLYI